MPTVIVQCHDDEVLIESSSDEVDVIFIDWGRLNREACRHEYDAIREAFDSGYPGRAERMQDAALHGEQWPED